MDSGILFDFSAGIATVTLHNPGKLNAVNAEMWRGLSTAMQRVAQTPEVRCVILRGAGSFGNIHSHTYGITGGNVAENMIWGRISARHAASLDAWDEKK